MALIFKPHSPLKHKTGYGAHYAAMHKSNCLLVSWVLMGNPYPVIEAPKALNARMEPFDSHYAVVDAKVRDFEILDKQTVD